MRFIYKLLAVSALAILGALWTYTSVNAAGDILNPGDVAQASRTCGLAGKRAQAVTAPTGSSAANATGVGKGKILLVCTQATHVYQGTSGVSGPTAGTGDTLLPSMVPLEVWAPSGGTYFGFRGDSAVSTCYVTECR